MDVPLALGQPGLVPGPGRGNRVTPCRELHEQIDRLAGRARDMDCRGIKEGLQEIVPEYVADFSAC